MLLKTKFKTFHVILSLPISDLNVLTVTGKIDISCIFQLMFRGLIMYDEKLPSPPSSGDCGSVVIGIEFKKNLNLKLSPCHEGAEGWCQFPVSVMLSG